MARRLSLAVAVATLTAASADAETEPPPGAPVVYATGLAPISKADYAKLPKLARHRAWLPKAVDLSDDYPLPGYQGQQPDCTAWASTYAARSYLMGRDLDHRPGPAEAMSPAYVYNRLRAPGSPCTQPVRLVDALNLLRDEGTVSFAAFPDDATKCTIPAPAELKQQAGRFRIAEWRAVDRETPGDWRTPLVLDDVKGTLARGVPVVFAIPVGDDFMAFKGAAVFRTAANPGTNWHAMALVGYDEDRQAFRLINSWGRRWGDGGYAWIGYDTFKMLAGEAYALETPGANKANAIAMTPQAKFDADVTATQCGVVKADRRGGSLRVSGFAGSDETLTTLRADADALGVPLDWQVAHHPWPQCEAEVTLARPLAAPGVTLEATREAGDARTGDPVTMAAGDRFGLRASVTSERPYLSLVYLQADGSAVELYRGQPQPDAAGRRAVSLGMSGAKAMRFEVAAPYGDEILIAVASAQPLFGPELKTYATERQFLTGLRAHLLQAPAGSVSAAVLRLKTAG